VADGPECSSCGPLEAPAPIETASWAVLTSLRSVDADAALASTKTGCPPRRRGRDLEPVAAASEMPTAADDEEAGEPLLFVTPCAALT